MKKILFTAYSLFLALILMCDNLWLPPLLSTIFPGGGQLYNKNYLKAGIFAAAEITGGILLYNEYKKDGEKESMYRDIFIGIVLISILDAYISKELKENIIKEEISDTLKVK